MYWQHWITFSIVAALSGSGNAKWSLYHLPWACSVVYNGDLIGACAIFDARKVLVSVDNFNQTLRTNPSKRYYQVIDGVTVNAGSNFMDPSRQTGLTDAQSRKAEKLYLLSPSSGSYIGTPIQDLTEVDKDIYGIAYDIGILQIKDAFVWTVFTQAIVVISDISNKTTIFLKEQEKTTPLHTCITYSWSQATNQIRYYEVMYLPKANCLDVFCLWNVSACHLFPVKPYHACFKSVKYVDVCPNARGAALFCPRFHDSTFAILTSAPSCGQSNMPGVYTTLPLTIEYYEKIYKIKFDVDNRRKYPPLGLIQPYIPW